MVDASPAALVHVARLVAEAIGDRRDDPVTGLDEQALAARLDAFDYARPRGLGEVASELVDLLRSHAVRSDHPRYLGLFNPPALVAGVAGDLVASAINPQLAVWSHAPAASAVERGLVDLFARLVWRDGGVGHFTSGGTEANHTALLTALAARNPGWSERGVAAFARPPAIYASAESHLAWIKIARACGLGASAVRLVPTDDGLRLTGSALARAMAQDEGLEPVMVVATAGTTAHGAIDDLAGIAQVGRNRGARVHVDAAWAGAALLSPSAAALLSGIDEADTVTVDPHKWLSVPMGTGLFLSREWAPLEKAFSVSTGYMPSASLDRRDPYIHSLQWSRRFIGARLHVALATLGLEGYRAILDRQCAVAEALRGRLRSAGWRIENDTALPVVCFSPPVGAVAGAEAIAADLTASGGAWLSTVVLRGARVLRACITSHETTEQDIEAIVAALLRATASHDN